MAHSFRPAVTHLNDASPVAKALPQHARFIHYHLPTWLKQATPPLRAALRTSLLASNQSRHDMAELLSPLQNPVEFASPLLKNALRQEFLDLLDSDRTTLVREWKTTHILGLVKTHRQTTTQSLLEAALQNFDAAEAEDGGFETGSGLYTDEHGRQEKSVVTPVMFAGFCRRLNLGQRFQEHLDSVLSATSGPDAATVLRRCEQDALAVAAHIARIKGVISPRLYESLITLQANGEHPDLRCAHLTINNVPLPGILVIYDKHIDAEQVLYIPQDPYGPLYQYPSFQALKDALANRLEQPGYETFFKRFVPQRHHGRLYTLKPHTYRWVTHWPNGPRLINEPASIVEPVARQLIQGDVLSASAALHIAKIKEDAKVLAVSSADADLAAREVRLQGYEDLGKSLLFFALSFVPVVGEAMLAVTAAEVIHSVYHGFEFWSRGDSVAALNDLLDVADTAASLVFTAAAVKAGGAVAKLVSVKLRNGNWRLWNPDLTPYRQTLQLPGALPPDSRGLYAFNASHYVRLDDQLYQAQLDTASNQWQLLHPQDPDAYRPPLLSNGAGGWRLPHERPQEWNNLKLIKRLGATTAHIQAEDVEPLMLISGIDQPALRQLHQEGMRPPALLRDSVKRLNLERAIDGIDLAQAEGRTLTPESPFIQLHLVTLLPEWPASHSVKVLDPSGNTLLALPAAEPQGEREIQVPLARLRNGQLLQCLEEQLDTDTYLALIDDTYLPYVSNPDRLALRLHEEALEYKKALFARLYQGTEQPETTTEKTLRQLLPDLPKSYLQDLSLSLGHPEQQRLVREESLNPLMHEEALQYHEEVLARAPYEGLFLDTLHSADSDLLAFVCLEQLPRWPQHLRLEMRDALHNNRLLGSVGDETATQTLTLSRSASTYVVADTPRQTPADLFTTLARALPEADRNALFGTAQVEPRVIHDALRATVKQRVKNAVAYMQASTAVDTAAASPGGGFDELFAVPTTPPRLTLREDNIYEQPRRDVGGYNHYVQENNLYYQVRNANPGWQLVDARNPWRAYKPYIRPKTDGGWEIATDAGLLGGGIGPSRYRAVEPSSSTFYTASDYLMPEPFTTQELARMRQRSATNGVPNKIGEYDRVNNGRYPLRDNYDRPLYITQIRPPNDEPRFATELVMPYLEREGYERVAQLYEEKLKVRTFIESDARSPQERVMIGQHTVVARRDLRKDEILGVYGGRLIPRWRADQSNNAFVIDVEDLPPYKRAIRERLRAGDYLSGDNILSRINTLFEFPRNRSPRQARQGYNAHMVSYAVKASRGQEEAQSLQISVLFTLTDIPAETELRWDYGYTSEQIRRIMTRAP